MYVFEPDSVSVQAPRVRLGGHRVPLPLDRSDARRSLRIAVAIASSGRPGPLLSLLRCLREQTRRADLVIVCTDGDGLAPGAATAAYPSVVVMPGPAGLCAKRNLILAEVADFDVVVFFDDDFVPDEAYLARAEETFAASPDVVVLTGLVLADGINGTEIDDEAALAIIQRHRQTPSLRPAQEEVYNAYGCNMALRLGPMRAGKIQFDETLPLYGWLEDVDVSRQLAKAGRILRNDALFGVHRGVKAARLSGLQFGYSQVANSVYLVGKGNLSRRSSLNQILRNVGKNALLSAKPEPWCDRRGRLRGNLIAIGDLLRGRLSAQNILRLR